MEGRKEKKKKKKEKEKEKEKEEEEGVSIYQWRIPMHTNTLLQTHILPLRNLWLCDYTNTTTTRSVSFPSFSSSLPPLYQALSIRYSRMVQFLLSSYNTSPLQFLYYYIHSHKPTTFSIFSTYLFDQLCMMRNLILSQMLLKEITDTLSKHSSSKTPKDLQSIRWFMLLRPFLMHSSHLRSSLILHSLHTSFEHPFDMRFPWWRVFCFFCSFRWHWVNSQKWIIQINTSLCSHHIPLLLYNHNRVFLYRSTSSLYTHAVPELLSDRTFKYCKSLQELHTIKPLRVLFPTSPLVYMFILLYSHNTRHILSLFCLLPFQEYPLLTRFIPSVKGRWDTAAARVRQGLKFIPYRTSLHLHWMCQNRTSLENERLECTWNNSYVTSAPEELAFLGCHLLSNACSIFVQYGEEERKEGSVWYLQIRQLSMQGIHPLQWTFTLVYIKWCRIVLWYSYGH